MYGIEGYLCRSIHHHLQPARRGKNGQLVQKQDRNPHKPPLTVSRGQKLLNTGQLNTGSGGRCVSQTGSKARTHSLVPVCSLWRR